MKQYFEYDDDYYYNDDENVTLEDVLKENKILKRENAKLQDKLDEMYLFRDRLFNQTRNQVSDILCALIEKEESR